MRPTFMGFESAKRGLAVNQKGLDIVGHNIMNLQTEGYTRQRVDVYAMGINPLTTRYGSERTSLAGQGAAAGGVSQTRDAFLDKRFREEYADVGYYDTTSVLLGDIEKVLNEFGLNPGDDNPNGTGLENALKEISATLGNFSYDADGKTSATILKTNFSNLTKLLNQLDSKLNDVGSQAKFDLKLSVTEVNDALAKVAQLNEQITQDMTVTKASNGEYYGPNELLDERNLLLDTLSQYADVKIEPKGDGSVDVTMNGKTVVSGKEYEMMTYSENNNGTVALYWQGDGKNVDLKTGALKAYTDVINGRGVNAQLDNEVKYNGVRYYRDKLNAFANTLAKTMNNIVPQATVGADGEYEPVTGEYRTFLQSTTYETNEDGEQVKRTDLPITAANITISDEWDMDSNYVIFQPGSMDNKYILQIKEALSTGEYDFRASGDIGDSQYSGSFMDFIEDYAIEQAGQKVDSDNRLLSTTQIAGNISDARDNVSGVSQDEETVSMMMYQKAYQAASRVMTALDEALDVLINNTGRVGR